MVTHKKSPESGDPDTAPRQDLNVAAAALLYDMAALQPTERRRFGYTREARAIARLTVPVTELVEAGTLTSVPFVGPSSARVVTELVREGRSPTLEAAIAASKHSAKVLASRELRGNFLSEHAMQRALAMPLPPSVVSGEAFRGDFQMHTTWSDGVESIGGMAKACMALGHTCMGVTDHSYGLPVARGISMEAALRQQQEIDELNARLSGRFRIFKGIEANIHSDGSLDLSLEERRQFQYVVAAPHAQLRRKEDQTGRMLAAVQAPAVAMLGHPRGRMYSTRPGVAADWRRVFEAAAAHGVAVEIDGNWHRQDIDWELARVALEAGCIFALDSDAHSIAELRYTDYSIAHARLAGIPSERVINCWTDERLEEWMTERREGRRYPRGHSAAPRSGRSKVPRRQRVSDARLHEP